MSSGVRSAGIPTGSEPARPYAAVGAPQAGSSDCLPAYERQGPASSASDAPPAVQVRWLDHQDAFGALEGSVHNAATSGIEAVQALAPRGARSPRSAAPDSEPRPAVHHPPSFTFTCTRCASRLIVANVAATKNMVVDCSACHCAMSPQFPAAEDGRSQRAATNSIGKKPRRALASAGSNGGDGDSRALSSRDAPPHDQPADVPDPMSAASSLASSPRVHMSPRDSPRALMSPREALSTNNTIRRSSSFGKAFSAFSKAFGGAASPLVPGADDAAATASRKSTAGRTTAPASAAPEQHPLDAKPNMPGAEGLALPCTDMVQPLVGSFSETVLASPTVEHPVSTPFAPPSPPPTPPGGAEAEAVPEKSSRGKGLGNFARAASFSKAFASKSKSKSSSSASRSATAPKGAIPAEVAKAQAAAAAAAAAAAGQASAEPPVVAEPVKAPAGAIAAPANVAAVQKKRTGSFGGRKTPPRRSHCSSGSADGGRQLVTADGKPTKNTPRCGDFEEYESGSSDFSEDEGPIPGQAIASAAFDDISGRLSGGDFVFSL